MQEMDWLRREALQAHLRLWLSRKERYWKQMSRCKILKEGDRNTRYFHMIATIRKRKLLMNRIVFQGQLVTEVQLIKKVIVNHFKQLYTAHDAVKINLTNLGLPRLTSSQSEDLIREVTKEEIREALMSCNPTKAPGYDGFNIKCIKHVWSVIGD